MANDTGLILHESQWPEASGKPVPDTFPLGALAYSHKFRAVSCPLNLVIHNGEGPRAREGCEDHAELAYPLDLAVNWNLRTIIWNEAIFETRI